VVVHERAETVQRSGRILNKIFVPNLEVIRAEQSPIGAAASHDPLPVQGSNGQTSAVVSFKWANPALLLKGEGNVTAISQDVDDKCPRDRLLNLFQIKQMFRGAIGPALDVLLTGDDLHEDSAGNRRRCGTRS